jgi:hypothetical protein
MIAKFVRKGGDSLQLLEASNEGIEWNNEIMAVEATVSNMSPFPYR